MSEPNRVSGPGETRGPFLGWQPPTSSEPEPEPKSKMSPRLSILSRARAYVAASLVARRRAKGNRERLPILPQSPEKAFRAKELAESREEARRVAKAIARFHGNLSPKEKARSLATTCPIEKPGCSPYPFTGGRGIFPE